LFDLIACRCPTKAEANGPHSDFRRNLHSLQYRREFYLAAWRKLRDGGFIYPCDCSRKDLALSAAAPNEGDDGPLYSGRCREKVGEASRYEAPAGVNWRFRVPDGEVVAFDDLRQGPPVFPGGQRLRRLRDLAARRRARLSTGGGG